MQSSLGVSLLFVLVVLFGGGVFVYLSSSSEEDGTRAGIADSKTSELVSRIESLESELETLRDVARSRADAPERQAVDPVSDSRIEAAVAKYLKANPVGAAANKGTKAGKERDLGQTFLHLQSDLSRAAYDKVWQQLREEGRVEEMVKMFEANAANNPSDPEAQVQVGTAYLMQIQGMTPGVETGKIARNADKSFDKALKLNPEHWDARFIKAQALSFWPPMFGKQAEAITNLETLRKQQESKGSTDKKHARTYMMLGNLYSQQGKKDQAMEAWRKGSSLFPDNAELKQKVSGK